jgi:hypothetical protein
MSEECIFLHSSRLRPAEELGANLDYASHHIYILVHSNINNVQGMRHAQTLQYANISFNNLTSFEAAAVPAVTATSLAPDVAAAAAAAAVASDPQHQQPQEDLTALDSQLDLEEAAVLREQQEKQQQESIDGQGKAGDHADDSGRQADGTRGDVDVEEDDVDAMGSAFPGSAQQLFYGPAQPGAAGGASMEGRLGMCLKWGKS